MWLTAAARRVCVVNGGAAASFRAAGVCGCGGGFQSAVRSDGRPASGRGLWQWADCTAAVDLPDAGLVRGAVCTLQGVIISAVLDRGPFGLF